MAEKLLYTELFGHDSPVLAAAWMAWAQTVAEAEYASRNTGWDSCGQREVISEFAQHDLAQEIHLSAGAAKGRHGEGRRDGPQGRCGGCAGCEAAAVTADMEHRIPWEHGGNTDEHNLDPQCRQHHRLKQRKDWTVTKPAPGTTSWTGPSRRARIVQATRYLT